MMFSIQLLQYNYSDTTDEVDLHFKAFCYVTDLTLYNDSLTF